jgi:hypothetical protein
MSAPETTYYIPPIIMRLADGTTMIKPGKAVQRARVADVVRWTGVHRKTLSALADCGLIRRAFPSPNMPYYYPAEVEEFIRLTETDPKFWTSVRTKAYLTGKNLKTSRPLA